MSAVCEKSGAVPSTIKPEFSYVEVREGYQACVIFNKSVVFDESVELDLINHHVVLLSSIQGKKNVSIKCRTLVNVYKLTVGQQLTVTAERVINIGQISAKSTSEMEMLNITPNRFEMPLISSLFHYTVQNGGAGLSTAVTRLNCSLKDSGEKRLIDFR